MDRQHRMRTWLASSLAACLLSGCGSLTPRNFRDLKNPAGVVRAGAVGLGEGEPDYVAIPAWIARLDDPDTVVRMVANENLKKRTRQDFGFVPWAEADQRAPAVARWQAWWQRSPEGRVLASPQGGVVTRRRKQ
jgi:hypothetical protein